MYKIYWIKYLEHTDPYKEGYIGLTSQTIEERLSEHKHNKKNKLLSNRCRKELVQTICLHDNLSESEAKLLEQKYRPSENIGWNINKGGDLPPSRRGKVGEKTLLIGEQRTEKQKQASAKHSERMRGNNSSGKRKNKVIHEKNCENCGIHFTSKGKERKFCCIRCAAIKRNQSQEYRNKLKEIMTIKWKNSEYKTKMSELIKKSLNV